MTHILVFDPPMCCPSGVCGPGIDPVLPHFAADLDWLKTQGVRVERYGLSQQPKVFAETDAVQRALSSQGIDCLPLVLIDGQIVARGRYPAREELASWVGVDARTQDTSTDTVTGDCGGAGSGCCDSRASLTFISLKKPS